jgi:hypothetical protein
MQLRVSKAGSSAGHILVPAGRNEKQISVYKLSGELESPERPSVTVKWFGKTGVIRVEVEGDVIQAQP